MPTSHTFSLHSPLPRMLCCMCLVLLFTACGDAGNSTLPGPMGGGTGGATGGGIGGAGGSVIDPCSDLANQNSCEADTACRWWGPVCPGMDPIGCHHKDADIAIPAIGCIEPCSARGDEAWCENDGQCAWYGPVCPGMEPLGCFDINSPPPPFVGECLPGCEERDDAQFCEADSQCEWHDYGCPGEEVIGCLPAGIAIDIACPVNCGDLDERSCGRTPECTWWGPVCFENDPPLGCLPSDLIPALPPCPPPLPSCDERDASTCDLDGACTWMVPGCADGLGTALPEAGCFPTTACQPGACGEGETCQEVVVDPCATDGGEITCDACGTIASVCLPEPTPPTPCDQRDANTCASDNTCQWLEPATCPEGLAPVLPTSGCYDTADCRTNGCDTGEACERVSINPCPPGPGGTSCAACGAETFVCLPTTNPPPPPACDTNSDSQSCLAAGCEWLVPGCGAGTDPILPQARCVEPTAGCQTTNDCAMGETCNNYVINPCWNSLCLACGVTIGLCE